MLFGVRSFQMAVRKFAPLPARRGQGWISLQLVRPDSTQSCILLAALNSCANHSPTTRSTAAIASPATAGVLLSRDCGLRGLELAGFEFAGLEFVGLGFSAFELS